MKLIAFITSTTARIVSVSEMYGDTIVTPPIGQGGQLHALPREDARGDDLAGELGHPVQVEDVVGDPERDDDGRGGEQADHPVAVGEDEAQLRDG